MKIIKEFKEFAFKGNVIDMAVGVIIGGAFGKIVTSLVNDIITPLIGLLVSGKNFSDLKFVISPAVKNGAIIVKPETAILYGNFIQSFIDFLIIAISIFIFIKIISVKRKKEEQKDSSSSQEEILIEIRDILKDKNSL